MPQLDYMSGVKIYDEMRTAHLERASAASSGMRLYYRKRYYDFDEQKAANVGVLQSSRCGIVRALLTKNLECVELLEPLFIRQMPSLILYMCAIKVGNILFGRKTLIVAYAIENLPLSEKARSLYPRVHRLAYPLMRRIVALMTHRFDRIAFGTQQSRRLYAEIAPRLSAQVDIATIAALEPPCLTCELASIPHSLLFLGAFEARKGIVDLMAAWPYIAEYAPDATLTIVGKGMLQAKVSQWAEGRGDVRLLIDPPRAVIHRELAQAATLILFSLSGDSWREQVGLPILEGLSHGCRIISSADTGLAPWLGDHGHLIVRDLLEQAEEVAAFLAEVHDPAAVTAALPTDSGRADAEEWLWRVR